MTFFRRKEQAAPPPPPQPDPPKPEPKIEAEPEAERDPLFLELEPEPTGTPRQRGTISGGRAAALRLQPVARRRDIYQKNIAATGPASANGSILLTDPSCTDCVGRPLV